MTVFPATPARSRWIWLEPWALTVPMLILFVLFFAGPLLLLVVASLLDDSLGGPLRLANWTQFLTEDYNLAAIARTLRLGLTIVGTTLLLAYPLALTARFGPPWLSRLIVLAALVPFLTSAVVRSFAWVAVLSRDGVINTALKSVGAIAEPLRLLPSEFGLVLALTQIEIPLMLLPTLVALRRIDVPLVEASQAAGASIWRTLTRVVMPMSLPGVLAGFVFVFSSSVTAYVSQSIIGGSRLVYLSTIIFSSAMVTFDWGKAAVAALVLLVSSGTVIAVALGIGGRAERKIYG